MPVRTERSQRWVRAYVGDTAVVDSRSPLLFWDENLPVPFYAFDRSDVRTDLLRPAAPPEGRGHPFFRPAGPVSEWFDVQAADRTVAHAAWVRDTPELQDLLIFSWEPGRLDRWTEEDEVVMGHPRDPHKRVDALASSRHVTVSLDGRLLADSHDPVLLFETGLPTRYYVRAADLVAEALKPVTHQTYCPYKGFADRYWSLPDAPRIAWSYSSPDPGIGKIAGRVAFYNEYVDIVVDGVAQDRPVTPFSAARP
jgi:uncharacterized protein (DUF427 family)